MLKKNNVQLPITGASKNEAKVKGEEEVIKVNFNEVKPRENKSDRGYKDSNQIEKEIEKCYIAYREIEDMIELCYRQYSDYQKAQESSRACHRIVFGENGLLQYTTRLLGYIAYEMEDEQEEVFLYGEVKKNFNGIRWGLKKVQDESPTSEITKDTYMHELGVDFDIKSQCDLLRDELGKKKENSKQIKRESINPFISQLFNKKDHDKQVVREDDYQDLWQNKVASIKNEIETIKNEIERMNEKLSSIKSHQEKELQQIEAELVSKECKVILNKLMQMDLIDQNDECLTIETYKSMIKEKSQEIQKLFIENGFQFIFYDHVIEEEAYKKFFRVLESAECMPAVLYHDEIILYGKITLDKVSHSEMK